LRPNLPRENSNLCANLWRATNELLIWINSLRALRPEIDRLAAGQFDSSDRQRQIISVLARIVVAEMDYRMKEAPPE
jgi:hypothetical protein